MSQPFSPLAVMMAQSWSLWHFLALLYEAVQKDHVFLMGTESHSAPHPSPEKSVPVSATFVHARVDPAGNAQGIYLSGKAVSHGIHRVSLVGLDFEFKFHVTPSVFCMRSAFILQTGTVSARRFDM